MSPRWPRHGLYAITPDEVDTPRLLARVDAALAAGVAMLQYRNKRVDDATRRMQAQALLALCSRHSVPLIVNDDWRLAADIGADGAHLGEHDGDTYTLPPQTSAIKAAEAAGLANFTVFSNHVLTPSAITHILESPEIVRHHTPYDPRVIRISYLDPIGQSLIKDLAQALPSSGPLLKNDNGLLPLKKSQKILDHMGSTELAANLFRATQAEEKLRRDQVQGKRQANQQRRQPSYEVGPSDRGESRVVPRREDPRLGAVGEMQQHADQADQAGNSSPAGSNNIGSGGSSSHGAHRFVWRRVA